MNLRELFLSAIEDENPKSFLDYIEQHVSCKECRNAPTICKVLVVYTFNMGILF